jgi:hypothetical protein
MQHKNVPADYYLDQARKSVETLKAYVEVPEESGPIDPMYGFAASRAIHDSIKAVLHKKGLRVHGTIPADYYECLAAELKPPKLTAEEACQLEALRVNTFGVCELGIRIDRKSYLEAAEKLLSWAESL